MVNQNETNTARHNDITRELNFNFSSEHFSSRNSQVSLSPDDLIVALANEYENKRARQVTEWEKLRVQNFLRSSS